MTPTELGTEAIKHNDFVFALPRALEYLNLPMFGRLGGFYGSI
jgi:hypothetical protein